MIRLEMKTCNRILTEKQEKYTHCHQVKLINMNEYLIGEEIQPFDKSTVIEQTEFTYSHLAKSFEKTNKNN